MNKLIVLSVSLVLLIAAFPLISMGSTGGSTALWLLGLAALVLGGMLPVLLRFVGQKATEDKPRAAGMEYDERI
ncbi:MAG: EmrB/QacA subfamily drug resistance transporter [Chloroflexi bacterium]|nr:MAG: EmrB/QacA subfamily drug resistance transporter [Chloroflexota bacterium]